jgi:hypothetical protein
VIAKAAFLSFLALAVAVVPCVAQPGWCWGTDYFRTSVAGGVITVQHENALYNCCPDYFDYSINQEGALIRVVETEIATMPCACMCCYMLPVEIGPVAPGQYQIDFSWHDEEVGEGHIVLDVTVPEWGKAGGLARGSVRVDRPPCQQNPPLAGSPDPNDQDPMTGSVPIVSAYPNPAREFVTIAYGLPVDGAVHLGIFGPGGNLVRDLFAGSGHAGANYASWDGKNDAGSSVPAGVYYCRVQTTSGSAQRPVILVR